jgi:hypothetical protein
MRSDVQDVPSPFTDEHQYRPEAEARGRPSIDAYGAFSDPPPSGFGAPPSPGVSRTMQYADPYAAVRASIVTAPAAAVPPPGPPSYEYQGIFCTMLYHMLSDSTHQDIVENSP